MRKLLGHSTVVTNMKNTDLRTVGDDDVGDTEDRIISEHLVDDCLSEFDVWRFVLYDHDRLEPFVEDYSVASLLKFAHLDRKFIRHKSGGVTKLLNKVADKKLPHPLFRCVGNMFLPERVKDCFPRSLVCTCILLHLNKRYKFVVTQPFTTQR